MINNQNQLYTFTAQLEEIPKAIGIVLSQAQNGGVPERRIAHLELALEEMLVNIVNYAYQAPLGEISIKTQDTKNDFKVTVIDNGVCFDPLSADHPDTGAKLQERPIGGMGIMLIRNIMDEVHYTRTGERNKITFIVHKNRPDLAKNPAEEIL